MIRPIVKYGASVLHQSAEDVTGITGEIGDLITDMVQTMYAAPGVGLAAPQIGIPLRIFVVDVTVGRSPKELMTFINGCRRLKGCKCFVHATYLLPVLKADCFPSGIIPAALAYASCARFSTSAST